MVIFGGNGNMDLMSFFAGAMTACFICTLVTGVIVWIMNHPIDQMVIEKGLDKHLRTDKGLSLGDLYLLLELSPKDIRTLHNALDEYVQQGLATYENGMSYKLIA